MVFSRRLGGDIYTERHKYRRKQRMISGVQQIVGVP
jgi:hypothetical protein